MSWSASDKIKTWPYNLTASTGVSRRLSRPAESLVHVALLAITEAKKKYILNPRSASRQLQSEGCFVIFLEILPVFCLFWLLILLPFAFPLAPTSPPTRAPPSTSDGTSLVLIWNVVSRHQRSYEAVSFSPSWSVFLADLG